MKRGCLVALTAVALLVPLTPLAASADSRVATAPTGQAVVLLHGLGRSERAMRPLADDLTRAGFRICNVGYPSRSEPPEALVAKIAARIEACDLSSATRLHFVGHSLGGILTRAYLGGARPPNLGRVVMLAPPNHGSEYVDLVDGSAFFRWMLGPTGRELGTGASALPQRLPAPSYEIGVIAGTWSINPFARWVLPGEHDGLVSVASTRLEGMTDFLAVAHSHTFIMRANDVSEAIVRFLANGRFK